MATLNSVPDVGAFAIKAGDDFAQQFTMLDKPTAQGGVPQNMSDWTFSAQWRVQSAADDEIPFTVDQTQKAAGIVILSLAPDQTRAMGRSGVFDLQGVAGDGTVKTFFTAATSWSDDVTRA